LCLRPWACLRPESPLAQRFGHSETTHHPLALPDVKHQAAPGIEVNRRINPAFSLGIAGNVLISLCTNSHKSKRVHPLISNCLLLFRRPSRRGAADLAARLVGRPASGLARQLARGTAALGLGFGLALGLGSAHAAPVGDTVTRFLRENQLLDAALAATQSVTQTAAEASGDLFDQVRDGASDLVINAMNFLGVPYRRGGNTAESGFDCSGFTRHVFENSIGLLLPRRSAEQANSSSLIKVQKDDLKPGDLVFFNTMRRAFSHVGIYIGDGKFVHAPRTGQQIKVEDMRASYWTKRFNGARRANQLGDAPATLATGAAAEADSVAPAATIR
jgi:cell wall-associated NlpC family hydrolase